MRTCKTCRWWKDGRCKLLMDSDRLQRTLEQTDIFQHPAHALSSDGEFFCGPAFGCVHHNPMPYVNTVHDHCWHLVEHILPAGTQKSEAREWIVQCCVCQNEQVATRITGYEPTCKHGFERAVALASEEEGTL